MIALLLLCVLHLSTLQADVLKKWGAIARFFEEFPSAVRTVVRMERSSGDIWFKLKGLQGLLTAEARAEVGNFMSEGVTMQQFEKKLNEVILAMWVDFHWWEGNPKINAAHGMRPAECRFH